MTPERNNQDHPDAFEKRVRFGCGFILGLVVGLGASTQLLFDHWGGYAGIIFFAAVVCGLLAVRYGDNFWSNLRNWF